MVLSYTTNTDINSGKIDLNNDQELLEVIGRVSKGEVLFVDMWGGYEIFKYSFSTFNQRLNEYIEKRKSQINYFNENYIRHIIKK